MTRWLLAILLIVSSAFVNAEDGIAVKFTIKKKSENVENTSSITALQKLDETAQYVIKGKYQIKLYTRSTGDKETNLTITIKDVSGSKPLYVGAKSLDLQIGTSSAFELAKNGTSYAVVVDTSMGTLH